MEITTLGSSKYPWADWLDGRVWLVRWGADFLCEPASIAGQAHTHARKADMAVATRTIVWDDGTEVRFAVMLQTYPVGSTWRPNLAAIPWERIKKVMANPR